ncbi:vitamin B6 photo-protection and homoeostasis-domain-containing protein [Lipomyces kononenkoae]|uniref:Vitamin B6 photo-protection and homoeostasis-domain-containing protein n=1 Tax=Lipomyces kononenkoae TaxID=34357 RepID=A0ACC3T9I4_LIPKO
MSAQPFLEERDANGNISKAYYDSYDRDTSIRTSSTGIAHSSARIEKERNVFDSTAFTGAEIVEISADDQSRRGQYYVGRRPSSSRVLRLLQLLVSVFLPTGYPDSVKSDYIDYQIYDSVQAFASSISMLLGNRAVLTSVGVGDKDATSTSALFITVIQETIGRLATITFAWRFGSMLEQECKKFRFSADLVVNAGIVCDCLSPYFPGNRSVKIFFLCCSGILKAICGVMANGSKAALTQHFTNPHKGSISDVAAKDSSQETVISLLGMLAGTVLVPYINTNKETWTMLTILITIHLFTNYRAVSSVVMETLNRHRTNIVFAQLMDSMSPGMMESDFLNQPPVLPSVILTPRHVSRQERILEQDGVLRWGSRGADMGIGTIGTFSAVRRILPPGMSIQDLLSIFGNGSAGYVLWYETSRVRGRRNKRVTVRIALIERSSDDSATSDLAYYARTSSGANTPTPYGQLDTRELRAWVHALYLARHVRALHNGTGESNSITSARDNVIRTLHLVDGLFGPNGRVTEALSIRGWDLTRGGTMIVSWSVPRLRVRNSLSDRDQKKPTSDHVS